MPEAAKPAAKPAPASKAKVADSNKREPGQAPDPKHGPPTEKLGLAKVLELKGCPKDADPKTASDKVKLPKGKLLHVTWKLSAHARLVVLDPGGLQVQSCLEDDHTGELWLDVAKTPPGEGGKYKLTSIYGKERDTKELTVELVAPAPTITDFWAEVTGDDRAHHPHELVLSAGAKAKLCWEAKDAEKVQLHAKPASGPEAKPEDLPGLKGNKEIEVKEDTTFTLVAVQGDHKVFAKKPVRVHFVETRYSTAASLRPPTASLRLSSNMPHSDFVILDGHGNPVHVDEKSGVTLDGMQLTSSHFLVNNDGKAVVHNLPCSRYQLVFVSDQTSRKYPPVKKHPDAKGLVVVQPEEELGPGISVVVDLPPEGASIDLVVDNSKAPVSACC